MNPQTEQLLQQIEQAFKGVVLGNGVSLHQTIAIDMYEGLEAQATRREPDEKLDWKKLIDDPELVEVNGIGGLSFFDAEGLRFHLPAYLSLAILSCECQDFPDVIGNLLFQLTYPYEYNKDRFAILNEEQRHCVCDVLRFLQTLQSPGDPTDDSINCSIQDFWNPPSATSEPSGSGN